MVETMRKLICRCSDKGRRLPCRIAPQDNGGAARSTGRRQARRSQLSSNPILEPLLAERLLLALAALGVPTEARPKLFQRAMGVIFEMILAECGRSSAADQKEASAQMHKTIATLPSTEFPNLTELREAIVAETVQAGAAKPSPEVAAEYADRLITTLRRQVAAPSAPEPHERRAPPRRGFHPQ